MNKILAGKDLEITKAIAEWVQGIGFSKTFESLLLEANLNNEEIPKTKVLDKKWTTILTMQKKISDLESKIKTMKDEFESSSLQGVSYNNKKETSISMVRYN